MQKSRSEPNCASKAATSFKSTVASAHPKRKSTGNLRRASSFCHSTTSGAGSKVCVSVVYIKRYKKRGGGQEEKEMKVERFDI